MRKTASTAKHATSRIPPKTLIGYRLREEGGQIIPTCNFKIRSIFILLVLLTACSEQNQINLGQVFYDQNPTNYGAYLAGTYALKHGEVDTASDFFLHALKHNQEDHILLQTSYTALISSGQIDKALPILKSAINTNIGEELAHIVLLTSFIKEKKYQQGLAHINQLPLTFGLINLIKPFFEAWYYFGLNDFKSAEKILLPLVTKDTEQFMYHQLAMMSEINNNEQQASKYYQKALNNIEIAPKRLIESALRFYTRRKQQTQKLKNYLQTKDYFFASELAAQKLSIPMATTITDAFAELLTEVATTYYQSKAFDTAIIIARLAIYLKPHFPLAQFVLGTVYMSNEQYLNAIAALTKIPHKTPYYSYISQVYLSKCYEKLDQINQAHKVLDKLINDKKNWITPIIDKGHLYRTHKQYQYAIKYYSMGLDLSKQLNLHETDWALYYFRGICFERLKDWQSAEQDLLIAKKLNPTHPYILNYLAFSWIDQGKKLDEALQLIKQSYQLNPEDGAIVDSLGWAYYKLGQYDKAAKYLERAILMATDDPVIYDHLGDTYKKLGRHDEAVHQWKKALNYNSDDIEKINQKILTTDL
jgi:tetratricopeptide (TPR) repeat protein